MKEIRVRGSQIINTNRSKSMREQSVVSYGYLTRDITKSIMDAEQKPAIMNFSTFEEQYLKENKPSVRRSIRRRAEKSRNQQYSDVESDTGSDGVTINSGGSGRSGDWAPSRRRVKCKNQKKRSASRPSLTDSGISLTKTDSGSLSSCQRFEDGEIPCDDQLIQHSYDTTSSAPSNNKPAINTHRRCSLRRSSSLSALPSFVKALDRHNPRLSRRDTTLDSKSKELKISIQEQEDAILTQCYQNEGLISSPEYHNNSNGKSYIFDCSQPLTQSKFPLPDHLNYPLCKYRYKSESVLNRVSPLKKLREGWKKIKPRKALSEEKPCTDFSTSTLTSDTFLEELSDEEEDNEAILARLSSNPTQSKSFLRKLWGKMGSKSYSANDKIKCDLSHSWNEPSFQRAVSTRSIPDALKDMWSKVHEVELNEPVRPASTLSKAASMPSLLSALERSEASERHRQREQPNYFSNFFKPMESAEQPKAKIASGTDVVKGVLGQDAPKLTKYEEAKQCLIDATLTSVTDSLQRNDGKPQNSKRNIRIDQNENVEILHNENLKEFNRQFPLAAEAVSHEQKSQQNRKERKISQHSMYASSFDIAAHCSPKSHFYDPQTYYGGQSSNMGHCLCCMHHNIPPQYGIPYYPQPTFVYEVPMSYGTYSARPNGPYVNSSNPSNVVAPLDVQMSIERKAERRKISDMVFDTFV